MADKEQTQPAPADNQTLYDLLALLFQAHPWHGIVPGAAAPEIVKAYIELVPTGMIDRLRHYFLSYKQLPQDAPRRVESAAVYDRVEAYDVIRHSLADYRARYGAHETRIGELRRLLT